MSALAMPAAHPLPDGIHVLERGWLSSNNILFIGQDQTALVDSAYLTHAPQTLALVQHLLQGRRLDHLVNTHLHSDHCGGNAALQAAYGCHTSIPAADAEKVRIWDEKALGYASVGQQCARFGFDATIAPGDWLRLGDFDWQAMAAPGHHPHSLIFYCPSERLLISADALWEHGFGVIFPELGGESGFAETRATLELIASLDVRLVIPGHGAPFGDCDAALARAFSRLDYLSADPVRNAQNAVKVLLKFMLLERQRMQLTEIPILLAALDLFVVANRLYFQQPVQALADWAVAQLLRAKAARIDGAYLLNAD